MDWEMTMVCWENMLHGTTTGEKALHIMRASKTKGRMGAVPVTLIFRGSEIYLNRKRIFSGAMLLELAEEGEHLLIRT